MTDQTTKQMKVECTECGFSKTLDRSPTDGSVEVVESHGVETGHKLRATPVLGQSSPL